MLFLVFIDAGHWIKIYLSVKKGRSIEPSTSQSLDSFYLHQHTDGDQKLLLEQREDIKIDRERGSVVYIYIYIYVDLNPVHGHHRIDLIYRSFDQTQG